MIVRQLERKPGTSALACLGIALAVSVLILGNFTADAVRFMIDYQFNVTQRQDVQISFFEPLSCKASGSITHLPGVMQIEPFRAVPCRIRHEHLSRRVAILGLPHDSQLYRLHEVDGQPVSLPSQGLLLSDKLARLLDVRAGDTVQVEVLEGRRSREPVPVSGVIQEYSGLSAYMSWPVIRRLTREQGSLSGAYLRVDPLQLDKLYRQLKATPSVSSVAIKRAAIANFEKTIAENLSTMRFYNVLFASIIAFGVVYNNARISLAERSREFATLRVMGFTRQEVSTLLWGELAVLTLVAVPLGLLLGYALVAWVVTGLDTELYRIPLVIDRSTYGMAATVVLIATFFSGWVVRRRIDHLDLIAVLKVRE
jgi:putative ABC transport system permease protein